MKQCSQKITMKKRRGYGKMREGMRAVKRGWLRGILALFLVLVCLGGCSEEALPKGAYRNEILTMQPVDQSKTLITVHYEHGAAEYMNLEQLIEEAFPQVDIVMLHDGSVDSAYPLRQNLLNGLERDIILTRSAPSVSDIAPEYLLDLSAQGFVGNYYSASLDSCTGEDGKLYYLPGPSDIYGVVYDRTMFEENGWEVPHSYSEFIALIDRINRAGLLATENEGGEETQVAVKAIQPSLKFTDAFQILFNTFAYDAVYRGAENQQWLTEYRNGTGSMVGHMESAADSFLRLFADGVLSPEDMKVRPSYRSMKLYRYHSAAMIFENQNAYSTNEAFSEEGSRHEVGIFPLWTSDEPDSDYLYAIPSYYYAINRASAEESPEKKQLLLDIMGFLSLPETQKKLIRGGLQLSHVIGVPMDIGDFGKEIQETVAEGRIVNDFCFVGDGSTRAVETVMRDSVSALVSGELSVEEWLKSADAARDSAVRGLDRVTSYGQAERTFTKFETAQLVGDMYRHETGALIALVFVGNESEGVNGHLYQGDITDSSLKYISATKSYREGTTGIAIGMMTGQQIMDYLSGSAGLTAPGSEEHIVVSGLQVEYAPWAGVGERLISCRLPDGRALNPDLLYQVAYCAGSLKDTSDGTVRHAWFPGERILDGTWEEHFISWVADIGGVVRAPEMPITLVWENG